MVTPRDGNLLKDHRHTIPRRRFPLRNRPPIMSICHTPSPWSAPTVCIRTAASGEASGQSTKAYASTNVDAYHGSQCPIYDSWAKDKLLPAGSSNQAMECPRLVWIPRSSASIPG